MNIFFLHPDIQTCAQQHCDKHVVKMIIEYAQLLSTAHHEHNSPYVADVMKRTHVNHPSAVWTRSCYHAYDYVFKLYCALLDEYTYRYYKRHASGRFKEALRNNPCPVGKCPPHPLAMPDVYKQSCPYESYRAYYNHEKRHIARWSCRPDPEWWEY